MPVHVVCRAYADTFKCPSSVYRPRLLVIGSLASCIGVATPIAHDIRPLGSEAWLDTLSPPSSETPTIP
ncbi:hypothetical protein IG631_17430 [Alternaria alternata]|nr:hypothetical protein IG631_17430 [Alternaria alternata]